MCPCVCGRVRARAHVFACEMNMYYMCGWYYRVAFTCLIQLDRISDSLTESEPELRINCLEAAIGRLRVEACSTIVH